VSGSIEGFSSVADALARGALSIFDRDDRGEQSERGTVSRLLSPSLRRFLGGHDEGGDDGDNDDSENNNEDDDNESEKDNNDSAPYRVFILPWRSRQ
jgi:hypothetical protein